MLVWILLGRWLLKMDSWAVLSGRAPAVCWAPTCNDHMINAGISLWLVPAVRRGQSLSLSGSRKHLLLKWAYAALGSPWYGRPSGCPRICACVESSADLSALTHWRKTHASTVRWGIYPSTPGTLHHEDWTGCLKSLCPQAGHVPAVLIQVDL